MNFSLAGAGVQTSVWQEQAFKLWFSRSRCASEKYNELGNQRMEKKVRLYFLPVDP
jgi:hypothetical protein